MALERAVLFIDGSNFYHAAKHIGIATGDLDYQKLADKLIMNRQLAGIRYYVGQVSGNLSRRSSQEKFLSRLQSQGVKVFKGRIERRMVPPNDNPLIGRLKDVVAAHKSDLRGPILVELEALCKMSVPQYTEKRVDVSIAVDMVTMAHGGQYDVAYLLSADGDFVPAVETVKKSGKRYSRLLPPPGTSLEEPSITSFPSEGTGFLAYPYKAPATIAPPAVAVNCRLSEGTETGAPEVVQLAMVLWAAKPSVRSCR